MECFRLLVAEPYVFHLRLDAVETEPVGKRNEHEHCLAEDLVPLVLRHELDGTAVMQTVGKLYEHDPHVVVECEEDPLEVLCLHAFLLGLIFVVENRLDLCETFHQCGHLVAEKAPEVIDGVRGVFHHIMKKSSYNRFVAESDAADNDLRYSDRMQYIRLT